MQHLPGTTHPKRFLSSTVQRIHRIPFQRSLLTLLLCITVAIPPSACQIEDDQFRLKLEEYRITCNPDSLDWLMKNFQNDHYIPVSVTIKGKTCSGKMRVRGDTSRGFSKKSLKIKMELPDSTTETINLNAEYLDKSYMHQHICSRIFRLAGEPCFLTSYAPVYMNGEYYGLFLRIENMDEEFLKRNGLDKKSNFYKAARDGAALSTIDSIEYHWEKKTNEKDSPYDLVRLIHDLDTCTPAGILDFVKQTFDYPSLLRQVSLNIYLCNGSTYYHNYFLYHDLKSGGKWRMFPWDMDKSLSYYDWKLPFEMNNGADPDNTLLYKLYLNKTFMKEVDEEIRRIQKIVLDNDIPGHMQEVAKLIEPWVQKDQRDKVNDISEWKQQVEKDMNFFKENDVRRIQQLHHEFQPFLCMDLGKDPVLDPVFRWTRIPNDLKIGVRYDLYLSRDPKFEEKATTAVKALEDSFYVPATPLEKGTWYYKVVARKGSLYLTGYGRHFHVTVDKANDLSPASAGILRLTKQGSPYRLRKDLEIAGNQTLQMESGTVLYVDSGVNIRIKGKLVCSGDTADRVVFRSSCGHTGWGILELNGCASPTSIRHADLCNGRLVYHSCEVSLYDVRFLNHSADLDGIEGRPSLVWGQKGKFLMDHCMMSGNGTGEGINLHGGWPRVTNSVFLRVPDAIEFISADSGLIAGNDVGFSKDDGIDLNDCRNIRITGNYIHHNFDKAVSAGVDHHGSSHNIEITGNIFYKNAYGCDIKDSSDAIISNNIIYDFRYGVLSRQKEPGYQVGGNIKATGNILFGPKGSTAFKAEGRSTLYQEGNKSSVPTERGILIDSTYFLAMKETPFYVKTTSDTKSTAYSTPSLTLQFIDSDLVVINKGPFPVDLSGCRLVCGDKKISSLPEGILLSNGEKATLFQRGRKTLPADWKHGIWLHETSLKGKGHYQLLDRNGHLLAATDR